MINRVTLTDSNLQLFAAQNYRNRRALSVAEFEKDFSHFKYLKKLFTRHTNGKELRERLILNHLISIYNVFEIEAATAIILFKLDPTELPVFKAFLDYLNYLEEGDFDGIPIDNKTQNLLKNI